MPDPGHPVSAVSGALPHALLFFRAAIPASEVSADRDLGCPGAQISSHLAVNTTDAQLAVLRHR